MTTLVYMASLALASTALAAPSALNAVRDNRMTLKPMSHFSTRDLDVDLALQPQTDVNLPYGLDNTNYVNVTLTVPDAVLLESITSLTAVDCAADSVALTFNNTNDLSAAYAAWSAYASLVLITNHLGDCDTDNERGFFVASTFSTSNANTLIAGVQKTDAASLASSMRANFNGLPSTLGTLAPAATAKRDVVADPDALKVSTRWDLPASQVLYELDPYVKATADSGSIAVGLSLDGYLDFDVDSGSLKELYVDVAASTSIALELELAVTAPYTGNFSYPYAVGYYAVDIPGIFTFGPQLDFAVGAAVDVGAAADVTVALGAEIANGTVHLDLAGNKTVAAGWTPTYFVNLTFGEAAAVQLTPFVSVTVELEFNILNGLLDLSGGLTPKVQFPLTATLDGTQAVDAAGVSVSTSATVTDLSDGQVCQNGLELVSDFEFVLDAFVTQFYKTELYSVTVPIANQCYTWA